MRVILVLMWMTISLWAAAGQIAGVQGQVSLEREGRTLSATVGMEIQTGDTILTQRASRAQLLFYDDTVVTLGPGSEFTIDAYDHAAAQPEARFSAPRGALRVMTGQISRAAPQNFELKGQTATIGIRGTHFLGVFGSEGDTVACTDGRITVGSLDTGDRVNVNAGQLTQVMANQAPTPPRAYSPDELRTLSSAAEANGETRESSEESEEAEATGEPAAAETTPAAVGVDSDTIREAVSLIFEWWGFQLCQSSLMRIIMAGLCSCPCVSIDSKPSRSNRQGQGLGVLQCRRKMSRAATMAGEHRRLCPTQKGMPAAVISVAAVRPDSSVSASGFSV